MSYRSIFNATTNIKSCVDAASFPVKFAKTTSALVLGGCLIAIAPRSSLLLCLASKDLLPSEYSIVYYAAWSVFLLARSERIANALERRRNDTFNYLCQRVP